jgi:hypothetical protein
MSQRKIEANANARSLRKLPTLTDWAVCIQLTGVGRGRESVLGLTVNLMMCDRGVHCTLYTPHSNRVSIQKSATPKEGSINTMSPVMLTDTL